MPVYMCKPLILFFLFNLMYGLLTAGEAQKRNSGNGNSNGKVLEGLVQELDIVYREGHKRWTLNLVMPKVSGEALRPGLVIIHGGGWMYGSKSGKFQQ